MGEEGGEILCVFKIGGFVQGWGKVTLLLVSLESLGLCVRTTCAALYRFDSSGKLAVARRLKFGVYRFDPKPHFTGFSRTSLILLRSTNSSLFPNSPLLAFVSKCAGELRLMSASASASACVDIG